MIFSEKVKRHWLPLTGLVIILVGGILALVLFYLSGNTKAVSKATTSTTTQLNVQRVSDSGVNSYQKPNKVAGKKVSDILTNEVEDKEEEHADLVNFMEVRRKLEKFLQDSLVAKEEPSKNHLLVSIKKALQLSPAELDDLERTSMAAAQSAKYNERCIHEANTALSKLLKQGKPPAVKQATFDEWKNSGFSAVKFISVIKECMQHYSGPALDEHCGTLKANSSNWHQVMRSALKACEGDTLEINRHIAQNAAIPFIYDGLTCMNGQDSAELEKCLREESLDGICNLAKKISTSAEYSKGFFLKGALSFSTKEIMGDKLSMMAKAFAVQLFIVRGEPAQSIFKSQLLANGIDFDVKAAFDKKDPLKLANAYSQSLMKSTESNLKRLCVDSMRLGMKIANYKQGLKDLTDIFKGTPVNIHEASDIEKILTPTLLLLNIRRVLREEDNDEFVEKLKKYNINSFEQALKEKSDLFSADRELYKELVLIEKCREYAQHDADIENITKDYLAKQKKQRNDTRWDSANLVQRIVTELKKDPKDQKCSFDLGLKKLICKLPELQDILLKIQNDKYASTVLLEFFENISRHHSLIKAVSIFEKQDEALRYTLSSESAMDAISPDFFRDVL